MKPLRSRAVKQTTYSSPLRILAVADGGTVVGGQERTLITMSWKQPIGCVAGMLSAFHTSSILEYSNLTPLKRGYWAHRK